MFILFNRLRTIKTLCLVLCLALSVRSYCGGSQDLGGANLSVEQTILYWLDNNHIKNMLLSYLKTIDFSQFADSDKVDVKVKDLLRELVETRQLEYDILTPNNYITIKTCEDAYKEALICTKIGQVHSPIYFDVKAIATQMEGQTKEQILMGLARMILHDHFHHFQAPSRPIDELEDEGQFIANYFLLTAKLSDSDTIQWSPIVKKHLNEVLYISAKDRDVLSNPDFVKVIKSADFHLLYQRCHFIQNRNEYLCRNISDRRLNLIEAWTHGDKASFEKAYPYYVFGIPLVPLAAYYGGGTLGAILLRALTSFSLNSEATLLSTISTSFAAGVYKTGSEISKSASLSYLANQINESSTGITYIDNTIDAIEKDLKQFIESAPRLKVSVEALREWDSNYEE